MQFTCPKCAKSIRISASQLSKQAGQLVCPQCLSEFSVPMPDGGGIAALTQRAMQPSEPAPKPRRTISFGQEPAAPRPNPQAAPAAARGNYCRYCGHKITAGSAFCPACGKALNGNAAKPKGRTAPQPKRTTAAPPPPPKPKAAKPRKSAAAPRPSSNWGMVLRTVLVVAAFFAIYFVLGSLTN